MHDTNAYGIDFFGHDLADVSALVQRPAILLRSFEMAHKSVVASGIPKLTDIHPLSHRHRQRHRHRRKHRRRHKHRHRQRHTNTHTHTDTQTHRHTDIPTHRHTDTQTPHT
jgi:hypothetical protein